MMTDVVDQATRSRMMAGIRGKDTRPELALRKRLHALGFRYRLHVRDLPGRPDIVLPKYGAVIFVHGCFWHGHGCPLFKWPKSRSEFWREKIGGNIARDARALQALQDSEWRVAVLWECAIRPKTSIEAVVEELAAWLKSGSTWMEISG
jgi:DNA mismatch endonuclease (patch repair protein)